MSLQHDTLIFQAHRFEPERALLQLQTTGVILIRAVFSHQILKAFLKRALRVFDLRQRELEAGTLPAGYAKNYQYGEMTYISLRELDLPGEVPYQIVQLMKKTLLIPLLQAYYQGPVWLNQLESNLRRQNCAKPHLLIPFHQDCPFQGNPDFPQLNCWVPLVPCGENAPSLEVAPIGLKSIWPINSEEAQAENPLYAQYALKTERVLAKVKASELWHPPFWPGDVLIMDPYVLHRTYARPEMSLPRYSIELRSLAAEALPSETRERYGMMRLSV